MIDSQIMVDFSSSSTTTRATTTVPRKNLRESPQLSHATAPILNRNHEECSHGRFNNTLSFGFGRCGSDGGGGTSQRGRQRSSSSWSATSTTAYNSKNPRLWLLFLILCVVGHPTAFQTPSTVVAWKFGFGRRRQQQQQQGGGGGAEANPGGGGGEESLPRQQQPNKNGNNNQNKKNNSNEHIKNKEQSKAGTGQQQGAKNQQQQQHANEHQNKHQQRQQDPRQQQNQNMVGPLPSYAAAAAAVAEELSNPNNNKKKPLYQLLYDQYWTIVSYKPPVGIVTFLTLTHLIVTGRLFQLYPQEQGNSVEAALQKQQQQQPKYNSKGRAFCLDEDDVQYQLFGGIDCVRQKLVRAALLPYTTKYQQKHRHDYSNHDHSSGDGLERVELSETEHELLEQVVHALSLTSQPGLYRTYVQQMIPPISNMEALMQQIEIAQTNNGDSHKNNNNKNNNNNNNNGSTPAWKPRRSKADEELHRLLDVGFHSAQVRVMDALVRACRNRLLRTTHRLARTVDHWSRRVESLQSSWFGFWTTRLGFGRGGGRTLERDRLRLAYAKAAYQAEIERLGVLAHLLLTRPPDLPDTRLLQALQDTEVHRHKRRHDSHHQEEFHKKVDDNDDEKEQEEEDDDDDDDETKPSKFKSWWTTVIPKGQGIKDDDALHPKSASAPPTAAATTSKKKNGNHSWKHWLKQKYSRLKEKVPSLSNYSIQWMADGASSLFSIRKLESNGEIYGPAATHALLHMDKDEEDVSRQPKDDTDQATIKSRHHKQKPGDVDEWIDQASDWTQNCRQAVCRILYESFHGSNSPGTRFNEDEFMELQKAWVEGRDWPSFGQQEHVIDADDNDNEEEADEDTIVSRNALLIAHDWTGILEFVDHLPHWRRMGEGKTLRLQDAAIVSWTRRLNILGLPLALLQILLANALHEFVKPYWPEFKRDAIQAYLKFLEILDQRVWVPLKGIYDEIMNRSKGLMSGFGLQLEERSLDHMLRDLGYGDGTAESRPSALEKAATEYERDLNQGLFMNFASGRLVRLLLVQVQQLKVGLLQALDTIDVLIKGNQIHFQILAAIPSILFAIYGTKLFVRFLYNIRAKDLRPVNAAHTEMTTYLNQLESLVLRLSSSSSSSNRQRKAQVETSRDALDLIDSAVLGEALLYIHRYKILLDFSSWSIPSRASEDIDRSLRQLLEALANQHQQWDAGEESADDDTDDLQAQVQTSSLVSTNMQWMRLVKEKHVALNQYF
ncbi:hypothetical protein ACA910_007231 [Epithemia clementina (nom. ined.)]